MTDLTQRQLHATILRSLKETGKRMAAKYEGGAVDQPAPEPRASERQEIGRKRRNKISSRSPSRS